MFTGSVGDRQADHGARQPEPDQRRPRARRQGPDDRPPRRRPRAGRARGGLGGLHEHRARAAPRSSGSMSAEEIAEDVHGRVLELTAVAPGGEPARPGRRHRPDGRPGPARRSSRNTSATPAEKGGRGPLRRARGSTVCPAISSRPTVLRGRRPHDEDHDRGDLRPGPSDHDLQDVEEAVALANDCEYGLTASVWTRSQEGGRTWLAERLEAGTVTVNDHMFSFTEPRAIWGGIKQTGMGRSHGPYGLLDISNIKFVCADFRAKDAGCGGTPTKRPRSRSWKKRSP